MTGRRTCRAALHGLPAALVAFAAFAALAALAWGPAARAGEPAPARRDDAASLTRLSDTQKTTLLGMLRRASGAERERLLARWSLAGAEVLDVFLEFAVSELSARRAESWPALLRYFHGIHDREVALLVLQVLDLDLPERTKVDALVLLNHHLMQEPWTLRVEIRGRTVELPCGRGGGSLGWGPIVKEGRFVSVHDVYRIRDRVTKLVEEERESERVRQHAAELLAVIAFRDAQDVQSKRRRARVLQGEFKNGDDIVEDFKRWSQEHRRAVQETQEAWEEERARTEALESTLAASPAVSQDALDAASRHAWLQVAAGLVGGVILGATGAWLVLRRSART